MSSREQVLNNLFHYMCFYLKNNGETCTCCCPTTAFTFDISNNQFVINDWNFQTSIPTIDQLQTITPEQINNYKKTKLLDSTFSHLRTISYLINLSRTENRNIVDDDLLQFIQL